MTVEQQTEYSMEPLADSLLTKQLIHIWQSLLAMRRERHFQTRDTCPTVFQPGDREEDREGEGWEGGRETKERKGSRDRDEGEGGRGRVGEREGYIQRYAHFIDNHTHLPTATLKYLPH